MKRLITFLFILSSLLLFTSCERNNLYNYIKENAVEDDGTDGNEVTPDTPDKPEVFVSTTGSDIYGDGTRTSPYRTIQHAIDNAPVPSLICVATGSYDVTSTVLMKSGVSLLGGFNSGTWERVGYQSESERAANSSVISYTGTETGVNFLDPVRTVEFSSSDIGSETYIEGFIIWGKLSAAAPCAVFVYNGASPVIRYNTIYGGSGTGTHAWAVVAAGGSNPSILYNRIDAPTGASSYTYSVYVYESFSTIKGNDLYADSSGTSSPCVIQAYYNSDVFIDSNSIIMGSGSSSFTGIRIDTPDTKAVIKGNNFSGGDGTYMGVYTSCSNTEILNNTISIGGSGSSAEAVRLNGAISAVIEGNTFNDSASSSSNTNGIVMYSSSTSTISRNIIVLTSSTTSAYCINDNSGTSDNKIYSNFLNSNGAFSTRGSGVYINNSSPLIVNNTILINNTASSESTAVYSGGTSNPVIINNIFSAKGSGSSNYGVYESAAGSDPLYLQNNLFMDCATALYYDEAATVIADETGLNSLAGGTTSGGNILQIITIAGGGVVDPGDWGYINTSGLDISGTYSGAMIDLSGILQELFLLP